MRQAPTISLPILSLWALLAVGCGAMPPPLPAAGEVVPSTSADFLTDVDGEPGLECAPPLSLDPVQGCLAAAANLTLWHEDAMSNSFVLESASYALDSAPIARFDAPRDDVPDHKLISVGKLCVGPGAHQLAVHLRYRGHGYGVFSYLTGYKFDVSSSHEFAVTPNATDLVVRGYERGGPTTPLEGRPAVDFRLARP